PFRTKNCTHYRRRPLRRAHICQGGRTAYHRGKSERDFRLLDFGQPEEGQTRSRKIWPSTLLPGPIRRTRAIPEYYLHGGNAEPTDYPSCEVVPPPWGEKILTGRLRLRFSRNRQCDYERATNRLERRDLRGRICPSCK